MEWASKGNDCLMEEFVYYLKSNEGFVRFMQLWKQQYHKLGHLGGIICLVQASDVEKQAIGGLLGKSYLAQEDIKVSYQAVIKAISESKFKGIDFKNIVEAYFETTLYQNKIVKEKKIETREQYFNKILSLYKDTYGYMWLENVLKEKNYTYRNLVTKYNENRILCKELIEHVMNAIGQLPTIDENGIPISVFANRITGDSHYFDTTTSAYALLLQAICYFENKEYKTLTIFDKNALFYDYRLLINDVSNYNFTCRLLGKKNGVIHQGWMGFYDHYEPLTVNLYNLRQIDAIDNCITKVFVIENPSVFSVLIEHARKNKYHQFGFICTNGQLNFSAYKLLDLVSNSHIQMYYCGDFDPEGLLIADTLKKRYNLILWQYSKAAYQGAKSNKEISNSRLNKLVHCSSLELQEIKNYLLEHKYSGYQEALIDMYFEDLKSFSFKD